MLKMYLSIRGVIQLINIITLKRLCYSKFNSFRIRKVGMQDINQLYQYISGIKIFSFVI